MDDQGELPFAAAMAMMIADTCAGAPPACAAHPRHHPAHLGLAYALSRPGPRRNTAVSIRIFFGQFMFLPMRRNYQFEWIL